MADRSPPDRLNIASFKQRKVCVEIDRIGPDGPPAPGDETLAEVTGDIRTGNSAITEDLERQEVERENLWKRLQAARAEGDQLRALAQRSTDEDLSASSAASSPRARMTRTVNGTGHTGPSEFCATSI